MREILEVLVTFFFFCFVIGLMISIVGGFLFFIYSVLLLLISVIQILSPVFILLGILYGIKILLERV